MSSGITIDTTRFNDALRYYVDATGKDCADALNKQMGNLWGRAAQFAPEGGHDIDALESKPWWPAMIQKIVNSGYSITRRRRTTKSMRMKMSTKLFTEAKTAAEQAAYRGQKSYGEKILFKGAARGMTRNAFGRFDSGGDRSSIGGSVVNDDMRKISAKIIKRRLSTRNSFRAVLAYVAREFGAFQTGFLRIGSHIPSSAAKIVKAVQSAGNNMMSEATLYFGNEKSSWPDSGFGHRPTPQEDVAAKANIGQKALNQSIDFVTDDMLKHARRILQKRGAEISAA